MKSENAALHSHGIDEIEEGEIIAPKDSSLIASKTISPPKD